jgi:hypothetical protein
MACFFAFVTTMQDVDTFNNFHPFVYITSLADKDIMNFTEAMKQAN